MLWVPGPFVWVHRKHELSPAVILMSDAELKQTSGARRGRFAVNSVFAHKQVFLFLLKLGRKSFYTQYASFQLSSHRETKSLLLKKDQLCFLGPVMLWWHWSSQNSMKARTLVLEMTAAVWLGLLVQAAEFLRSPLSQTHRDRHALVTGWPEDFGNAHFTINHKLR